jgi:hypothetical protein
VSTLLRVLLIEDDTPTLDEVKRQFERSLSDHDVQVWVIGEKVQNLLAISQKLKFFRKTLFCALRDPAFIPCLAPSRMASWREVCSSARAGELLSTAEHALFEQHCAEAGARQSQGVVVCPVYPHQDKDTARVADMKDSSIPVGYRYSIPLNRLCRGNLNAATDDSSNNSIINRDLHTAVEYLTPLLGGDSFVGRAAGCPMGTATLHALGIWRTSPMYVSAACEEGLISAGEAVSREWVRALQSVDDHY